MDSTAAFAQLQWRLVDQTPWRYEVIRPLVLFADRTATQRAHETATHPETVRTLHRRFRQQGMVGLLPANVEVTHINLNDDTVEGMRHKELPIFSVQYHPEAAPGPHDASYFFEQFADLIENNL